MAKGESDEAWAPLRFLVGAWTGEESGAAGEGKGERAYEFIMRGKYLFQRNRSTFDPQEKNPEGEVHEDWGIFSHDTIRDVLVLREFHIEGFVNQYTRAAGSSPDEIVFESEGLENLAEGWRARVTLTKESEDAFRELFELAKPGAGLKTLIRNRWTRAG